jgi:hypothetical protein
MRITSLAAVTLGLALAAGSAIAAPDVQVTVGPKLSDKAVKTYGIREVETLADRLRHDVQRELARTGAYPDGRIELTLVDAKPNRPTSKEMGAKPGLSFQSFGVGGARIEGRIVAANGSVRSLSYSWYETDIRNAPYQSTWGDAEYTFDNFARRLSRGDELATR